MVYVKYGDHSGYKGFVIDTRPTNREEIRMNETFNFHFHDIAKLDCPPISKKGMECYRGYALAEDMVGFLTNKNVRDYLLGVDSPTKKTPTRVHKAIAHSAQYTPDKFPLLSNGLTLVAAKAKKVMGSTGVGGYMKLTAPSIINGANTYGTLMNLLKLDSLQRRKVYVPIEILTSKDEDLITEITIARNQQNAVKLISLAGRRGMLDGLEASLQESYPKLSLKKKETEGGENIVDSEELCQALIALTPPSLWTRKFVDNTEVMVEEDKIGIQTDSAVPSKWFTYNAKARCLQAIMSTQEGASNSSLPGHQVFKHLYEFYLSIVGNAYTMLHYLKTNEYLIGLRVERSLKGINGKRPEVHTGFVFPLLSAISLFAKEKVVHSNTEWSFKGWKEIERPLIDKLVKVFEEDKAIAQKPEFLGKQPEAYIQLHMLVRKYLTKTTTRRPRVEQVLQ
jgi:hypothetical protein